MQLSGNVETSEGDRREAERGRFWTLSPSESPCREDFRELEDDHVIYQSRVDLLEKVEVCAEIVLPLSYRRSILNSNSITRGAIRLRGSSDAMGLGRACVGRWVGVPNGSNPKRFFSVATALRCNAMPSGWNETK
jgi:hypothetical protein